MPSSGSASNAAALSGSGRVGRPWAMLAVMVFGQAATTVVTVTPAFLIPYLHERAGMSLAQAGLLAGAPHVGLVLTLIVWGALVDRFGERRILLIGLTLTTVAVALSFVVALLLLSSPGGYVWLGIAFVVSGGMSACINNASGRLITGWFPAERRGLAMGIRQTCQPVGMAIAALAVPACAAVWGVAGAIAFGGLLTLVSLIACAAVVVDPKLPARAVAAVSSNPYRESRVLARIHIVSVLLIVPQFALATFGLVWFTLGFGWSPFAAGLLVSAAQLLGAIGRILVGIWSDRVASRLLPLRQVAIAGIITMLACALFGAQGWAVPAAVAYVLASCVSVADNGLAFTSVAEIAGPRWAGRALGMQNTGQFIGSAVVPALLGGLIGVVGIPGMLALVAVAPLAAVPLVPSDKAALLTTTRAARDR